MMNDNSLLSFREVPLLCILLIVSKFGSDKGEIMSQNCIIKVEAFKILCIMKNVKELRMFVIYLEDKLFRINKKEEEKGKTKKFFQLI